MNLSELNSRGRVILVVDDSPDCVATLELALGALEDVAVRGASSAEEALAMLDCHRVAAVITDVQLPGLSGFELLARLRERVDGRALPVVVISADADPGAPAMALRMGADAFFAKPFSPSAVRRKVEELIYANSSA